jgi:hypothetical protein
MFLAFTALYFVFKSNSQSSLGEEWGEYKDIYEYRKDEEGSVFLVDGYVVGKELETENSKLHWVVEIVFYNEDIPQNLRKSLNFPEGEGIKLGEGFNYEFVFEKGPENMVEIDFQYIDTLAKKEEYLWNLFVMMVRQHSSEYQDIKDNTLGYNDLSKYREVLGEEGISIGNPFDTIVLGKFLEKYSFLSEEQRDTVELYLNMVEDRVLTESTLFPCYVSKSLNVEYRPSAPTYEDPLNLTDVETKSLVESLYYLGAEKTGGNRELSLFVDKLYFCKEEPLDKYVEEFNQILKYLYSFSNIDLDTVALLRIALERLNELGYDITLADSLDEYLLLEKHYASNTIRVFLNCIIDTCSVQQVINWLPSMVKTRDGEEYLSSKENFSYGDPYSSQFPSIILLGIINNEE